ncbi:MAG: polyprenyl synthetase family protein [Bacteroidetes bacterium]|nr:MAG: polyprenyl synthetase family protein [Bacteroidota bacterium]
MEKIITSLQQEIEDFILTLAAEIGNKKPENLYLPIRYTLSQKGKRIRPLLTLLSGLAFEANKKHLLLAGAAIETFHNFTLIHDDIMDNAPLRRGLPTVFQKWNSNIAILSGDAMLIYAYQLFHRIASADVVEMISRFNEIALEVCEGQQLDMDFSEHQNITKFDYLEMIRKKTAVLPAFALWAGGKLGQAPENDLKLLFDIGINLGLAFQIKDDWLDVFGDNETGKSIGGDLKEKKKTIVYFTALEKLKTSEKEQFIEQFHQINSNKDIQEMIFFLKRNQIDQTVNEEVNRYTNETLKNIQQLSVKNVFTESLQKVTNNLINRNK